MKGQWLAIPLAVCGLALGTARADGMSDPMKARAACEKQGKAGDAKAMRACCDNQILVAKLSDQKRLVEQCVKGKVEKGEAKK